ncbi:MAG: phytoene/squalene synthase family protein [Actinobacteria bacterium]|nr:phytoene/squalene synthase family protein [Actinomycetota bacterium]
MRYVRRDLIAAGIRDPALRLGYERCRRLNARHGKSYYLATLLLPAAKRPYVHALYGFARSADDIVDQDEPAGRCERFTRWSTTVRSELDWGVSSDPIRRALIDTLARWRIPTQYVNDFLDSMAMDLTVTQYETYEELTRYMWGSAAVIGLQMLPILGRASSEVDETELKQAAVELGLAFQLTNFLRDIGEDLDRGRVYLPMDSLAGFGVDRARLHRRVADEPVRNLIAYEIARVRAIYARAERGVPLVALTSQDCLRTAITLYRGILDEIERAEYDVFSQRATVGLTRRASVAARGLARAARARRGDPTRPRSTGSATRG